MKSKTYLYLGIFAVLVIAAYYLTTDREEKTSSYKLSETKLFELDSVKVDKIEIKDSRANLVISKTSGDWRVVEPYDYRTVNSAVESMVSNLKNMKLESIVSANPNKKETYGFKDSEQAEISVYEGGILKGKFLLGNNSAASSSYIKKLDSDNIYIADNLDRNFFVKPTLDEWRDKNIVSIPKEGINAVEFVAGAETFMVKKDSTGKFFIGPDTVGAAFDGILNLLGKFETTGFKDTTLAPQTEFDEVIKVDWGNKSDLNFLKLDGSPVKYLVQVSGDKQVYEVDEAAAKNLLKTKKEILGK
ncbi:MAG: DUF4340 domain-containing protein [Bacteroidota bacterium]|nr:DUF4340 domain-containing protein [Bacteroidota bacterium]